MLLFDEVIYNLKGTHTHSKTSWEQSHPFFFLLPSLKLRLKNLLIKLRGKNLFKWHLEVGTIMHISSKTFYLIVPCSKTREAGRAKCHNFLLSYLLSSPGQEMISRVVYGSSQYSKHPQKGYSFIQLFKITTRTPLLKWFQSVKIQSTMLSNSFPCLWHSKQHTLTDNLKKDYTLL